MQGQGVDGAFLPGKGRFPDRRASGRNPDGPGRERIAVVQVAGEIAARLQGVEDADDMGRDGGCRRDRLIAGPMVRSGEAVRHGGERRGVFGADGGAGEKIRILLPQGLVQFRFRRHGVSWFAGGVGHGSMTPMSLWKDRFVNLSDRDFAASLALA